MGDSSIPSQRNGPHDRASGSLVTEVPRSPESISIWGWWSAIMIWIAESFMRRFESLGISQNQVDQSASTTTDNSDYDQSISIIGERGLPSPVNENMNDGIRDEIVGERTAIAHIDEFIVSVDEEMSESSITRDEEPPSIEKFQFESPNSQNQPSPSNTDSAAILTSDTGWTYFASNPKAVVFLLTTYIVLLGFVLYEHKQEEHIPSGANNLLIMSVSAFSLALSVICSLSWIHEHLRNPSSSRQNLYIGCYKILLIAYYILCILAYVSLLSALLTLELKTSSQAPSPSPHAPSRPARPHSYRAGGQ